MHSFHKNTVINKLLLKANKADYKNTCTYEINCFINS